MGSWDGLAVRLVDMRVNGRGGMGGELGWAGS